MSIKNRDGEEVEVGIIQNIDEFKSAFETLYGMCRSGISDTDIKEAVAEIIADF
jgi:hypothetical protein